MQKLQARYKAVVASLGAILGFLYVIQASSPNHYITLAIGLLTALGVHQVQNKGA